MKEPFLCTSLSDNLTEEMRDMSPAAFREMVRQGVWRKPTAGCCAGHIQLNLVILPQAEAEDFREFCERNPKPCPLIEMTGPGQTEAKIIAPGSDLRCEIPGYKLFQGESVTFLEDLKSVWRDDFVSFLIGCSFTFENALTRQGIPMRHIELERNVPMYISNIPCQPAGPFHGNMVVSMRPIAREQVTVAAEITSHYPDVHGGPIYSGDPAKLGIGDINRPDFGDPVPIRDGEVPVFWACGVTPQVALMNSRPEIAITHAPGLMFIADVRDEDYYR